MFLTQISEGGILSIYDKTKMMCRTWIEAINNLFSMGKELEESVDGMKSGIVKDVTLTEVDKHYTLTILYDDDTSDTVTWDDSTVGIEDITLTYNDGVYVLTIILEDGTRYNFSIPVGNVVTEEELQSAVDTINATITAMNVGSPDDTASSTGSLWARMKNAVARITTNEGNITNLQGRVTTAEGNITSLQNADANNVKKTGNQTISGSLTFITTLKSSIDGWGTCNEITCPNVDKASPQNIALPIIKWTDKNGSTIAQIYVMQRTTGNFDIVISTTNSDGTSKTQVLLSGDV